MEFHSVGNHSLDVANQLGTGEEYQPQLFLRLWRFRVHFLLAAFCVMAEMTMMAETWLNGLLWPVVLVCSAVVAIVVKEVWVALDAISARKDGWTGAARIRNSTELRKNL